MSRSLKSSSNSSRQTVIIIIVISAVALLSIAFIFFSSFSGCRGFGSCSSSPSSSLSEQRSQTELPASASRSDPPTTAAATTLLRTVLPPPMQPTASNSPAPAIEISQRKPWHRSTITAAIVMFLNNETRYLVNFVKYHIALGFDKFIIYENDEVPQHEKLLIDANINRQYFKVVRFPGQNFMRPVQRLALDDFLRRAQQTPEQDPDYHGSNSFFKNLTHFTHIDVDEYIALKKHHSIKDLIADHFWGNCAGLNMHYRHFGSSGHERYSAEPVVTRFTKCGVVRERDFVIKTIAETKLVSAPEVHNVEYHNPDRVWTCNSLRHPVIGLHMHVTEQPRETVQLNHYRTRSYEEFMIQDQRGRTGFLPDSPHYRFTLQQSLQRFTHFDQNTWSDTTAADFWKSDVAHRVVF